MNESLLDKLKRVHLQDIGHIFLFLFAILPAAVYRHFHPHLWLLCEENEARDNGYWFFRYLREAQPQVDALYAIGRHTQDYPIAAAVGQTVEYGSFFHWICYLAAEVNISSQKKGKPNAAVCYALEVILGWLKNKRVFLQHGVIKDDLPFLHYDKTKMCFFSCGAEPEYNYIKASFGYPEGAVQYTGLCRFDSLLYAQADTGLVLIVPTWRMYLQRTGDRDVFLQSSYYRHWSALLRNPAFSELLRKTGKHAVFCVHREMGDYESLFSSGFDNIRVLSWREADISALIRSAGMLITDYSSIFMDFAFMKRPILYYQFDREEFRAKHLPKGYFDYRRDGFGPICETEQELLQTSASLLKEPHVSGEYLRRIDAFYTLRDDRNCERTYKKIVEMLEASRRDKNRF